MLSGFAQVSEHVAGNEDWVKGHLISEAVTFELAFNEKLYHAKNKLCLMGTQIVYLQLLGGKKNEIFEFSLGRITTGRPTQDTFQRYVAPFIIRLKGYRYVAPGAFATFDPYMRY